MASPAHHAVEVMGDASRGHVVADPDRPTQRHHPTTDALADRHGEILKGIRAVAGQPADDGLVPAIDVGHEAGVGAGHVPDQPGRALQGQHPVQHGEQPVAFGEQSGQPMFLLRGALRRRPLTPGHRQPTRRMLAHVATIAQTAARRHPVPPERERSSTPTGADRPAHRGGGGPGSLGDGGPVGRLVEPWAGMRGLPPVDVGAVVGTCRSRPRTIRPISTPTITATASQAATPMPIQASVEMATPSGVRSRQVSTAPAAPRTFGHTPRSHFYPISSTDLQLVRPIDRSLPRAIARWTYAILWRACRIRCSA